MVDARPLVAVVCAVPLLGEAVESALDFAQVRAFASAETTSRGFSVGCGRTRSSSTASRRQPPRRPRSRWSTTSRSCMCQCSRPHAAAVPERRVGAGRQRRRSDAGDVAQRRRRRAVRTRRLGAMNATERAALLQGLEILRRDDRGRRRTDAGDSRPPPANGRRPGAAAGSCAACCSRPI